MAKCARWWWMAAMAAAVAGASGCTTAQRKTTPFYKASAGSASMAAKASEGKSEGERAVDRVNVWPLAYWNRPVGSVLWPVVTFSEDHFALFPLYSQFRQDGEGGKWDEFNVVWPWAQFDTKGKDYRVFPVYWGKDRKGKGYQAVFPLYWNGDGYNGLLPLWWKTTNSTTTILAGWGKDGYWAVPWVGAWGKRARKGNYWWVAGLGILGGHKNDRAGGLWAFPLFYREGAPGRSEEFMAGLGLVCWYDAWEKEKEFSVLASLGDWRWRDGTNVYWRVWPLAGRKRDADFAERWGWLDGERLPEGLRPIEPGRRAELRARAAAARAEKQRAFASRGKVYLGTNEVEVAEVEGYEWTRWEERWWLAALAGREERVTGHWLDAEGEWAAWDGEGEAVRYEVAGRREWGNGLVAKGRMERRTTFDAADGGKVGDVRQWSGHVLGLLYRWSGWKGVEGEEDWARRRVLWKLWDWERRGEDVSLDVFPGVTWDSRGDGYRKASWLWRLFRWERDAEGATKVDVLFLPVWRGGGKAGGGGQEEEGG